MPAAKRFLLLAATKSDRLHGMLLRMFPRRSGPPPDRKRWDREYATGGWEWLKDLQEAPHNYIIAAYCNRAGDKTAILDIGCGEGVLQAILDRIGYRRYVGIDVSQVAIEHASAKANARTSFVTGDAMDRAIEGQFDTVVLNEVLYYFPDPLAILERLADRLNPGGQFVVSMAQPSFRDALAVQKIWRDIASVYKVAAEVSLRYPDGLPRTIKLFAPSSPSGAAQVPP